MCWCASDDAGAGVGVGSVGSDGGVGGVGDGVAGVCGVAGAGGGGDAGGAGAGASAGGVDDDDGCAGTLVRDPMFIFPCAVGVGYVLAS